MIYFIEKHQKYIISLLFFTGFVFSLLGISAVETKATLWDALFRMLPTTIFIDYPVESNIFTAISKILFLLATIFAVALVFFSNLFNRFSAWLIQRKPYNLVIGYGRQNQALLSKGWGKGKTIIIEPYVDLLTVSSIQDKHYAIKQSYASEGINKINLKKLKNCVISVGGDDKNIASAIELLERLDDKIKRRVFVRIENKDLAVLFKHNIVKTKKNNDVIIYSANEMLAKDLFTRYVFLSERKDILTTKDDYSVVTVGDSELAIEIVYYLASIAHLPNQNILTIYCICNNAEKFVSNIYKKFSGIDDIPHLKVKPITLDDTSLDFYTHDVWRSARLVNIFIATHNEEQNLDIAINLQDTTYIQDIASEKFQTKVFFAAYQNTVLGENIDNNKDEKEFANFYSFANMDEVICGQNLSNADADTLAKLVNFSYDDVTQELQQETIEKKWETLAPHLKYSNRSQAQHLDIKLLVLGFKKLKVNGQTYKDLLAKNEKIIKTKITNYDDIVKSINLNKDTNTSNYRLETFPTSFDDALIDQLARAEHNRWNASHYLLGWKHHKDEDGKGKNKLHRCLLPIEAFNTNELKITYQYDLQSVVNIPKYLAYVGYEIVDI
jgi:hypothetical protein